MSKNGSIWPWLIGGAAVAGGIAWATSASAKPPLPVTSTEPMWMNDAWLRDAFVKESGIVPIMWKTGSTITEGNRLMAEFEKPEQLEPAARALKKILNYDGISKRKPLLSSGTGANKKWLQVT